MNMAELADKLVKEDEEVNKTANTLFWVGTILLLAGIIISIAVSGGIIAFLSVLAGALCIEHSGKKQNEHLVRLRAVSEAWEAMSNDIGIQLDATATEQIDKINTKMKNK